MIGLAIDTSTFVMGIAIANEEHVLAEFITNENKNHSIRLMPAIENILKTLDMTTKDLDRIIVAKGPGSYTGVRIGTTVAKTLAWSLNIPLVGVSSLEVLAQNGRYFNGYISSLFDARRGQIYTGLYEMKDGELSAVEEEQIILSERWGKRLKRLQKPILFLGKDSIKHREPLLNTLKERAFFGQASEQNPRPGELAMIGMHRQAVANVHHFTPNYIQMAEAEKKWLSAQKSGENK